MVSCRVHEVAKNILRVIHGQHPYLFDNWKDVGLYLLLLPKELHGLKAGFIGTYNRGSSGYEILQRNKKVQRLICEADYNQLRI